ncbi:MAG: hypothetical protein ACQETE_01735 [Bacteroidota bacterium]
MNYFTNKKQSYRGFIIEVQDAAVGYSATIEHIIDRLPDAMPYEIRIKEKGMNPEEAIKKAKRALDEELEKLTI